MWQIFEISTFFISIGNLVQKNINKCNFWPKNCYKMKKSKNKKYDVSISRLYLFTGLEQVLAPENDFEIRFCDLCNFPEIAFENLPKYGKCLLSGS